MMSNLLLIVLLISVAKCKEYLQRQESLHNVLQQTTDFFEKLKVDYASQTSNAQILNEIERKITAHVKNATESIITRKKREMSTTMEPNKGINVLDGFQTILIFNISDVRDITFFSLQNEPDVTFVAILDFSKLSVYQLNDNKLYPIAWYQQNNGIRIVVDSYGPLLIIQNRDNTIVVMRFSKNENTYDLRWIQDIESYNVTHITTWYGMNQQYLGVASVSNISIFTWVGEHFDLRQVINIGARKLLPFHNKGFMHLATTGPATIVLRYSFRSTEFITTQKLPSSGDVSNFRMKEGHRGECFVCLSTASSLVLYKEIHDRFVPFQRIQGTARSTILITLKNTIVLLYLHEDSVTTYQYDGWRFVRLNVKLSGVRQFRKILLNGTELLLVEYTSNTWTLIKPTWILKKSWKGLQDEIRTWCVRAKETAGRGLPEFPDLKGPVRIVNGHIAQLSAENINTHETRDIDDVRKRYEQLVSKLQIAKDMINRKRQSNNPVFATLHAKKVRVACETKCRVNNLKTEGNPFSKLRMSGHADQVLNFKTLKVNEIKNTRCPLPSIEVEKVTVKKSINEMSFEDLQKNLLKITGDQEISGEYNFENINATNAIIPLHLVSRSVKQEISAKKIKVKELNLTDSGFLLPLNGTPTTITGSITASKVRLKDDTNLRGKITGDFKRRRSPLTVIFEPLNVTGDYLLQNVTFENLLRITDLVANDGKSVNNILSNAIPLHENVLSPLALSSEKMKWNNVILHAPLNWITANSKDTVRLTGRKRMLQNVEVTKTTYDNLHLPKIETELCGVTAIVPEIKLSTVTMVNVTVKKLSSSNVTGSIGQLAYATNSPVSFKLLDLSTERLYRKVIAKNITVSHIAGIDLNALEKLANSWIEPNILKRSIVATDLVIDTLYSPTLIVTKLPRVIRNMVSIGNIDVKYINNINFADFLTNVVKLDADISLGNITFDNGFTSNNTRASNFPSNLSDLGKDPNLQGKRISGNLETHSMILPDSYRYVENNNVPTVTIWGSAIFSIEPIIQYVNDIDLQKMSKEIWMTTDTTIFSGKDLQITNASMKADIIFTKSLNTMNFGWWKNISDRIFSKTKPQEITVPVSFENAEISVLIGSHSSVMKSLVPNFNDMLENALLRDKEQEVNATWKFNKLNVLGTLNMRGKINGMNLNTDVLRHGTQGTVVTGKKTVVELTTKHLQGLNFKEWADNALTRRTKKLITIKGRKSFNTVTFNDVSVRGTVMGVTIDEALLKSGDQKITGRKAIQGFVNASEIIIDGLINDVNLTDLIDNQLKKRIPSQRIKTEVELQRDLHVFGDLTVNGLYGDVELNNFNRSYSKVTPVARKTKKLLKIADAINIALQYRAVYLNKLEIVNPDSIGFIEADKNTSTLATYSQCDNKTVSFPCEEHDIEQLVIESNPNDFLLIKPVLLVDGVFVICVQSDSVIIYQYNNTMKNLFSLTDFHVPNIIHGLVENDANSLWIALRLSTQTLLLRYEPPGDIQEYVLPATNAFTFGRPPSGELLLLLSDGVWRLGTLSQPQRIIEIPFAENTESFARGPDYYVKSTGSNNTSLMKARYVGS